MEIRYRRGYPFKVASEEVWLQQMSPSITTGLGGRHDSVGQGLLTACGFALSAQNLGVDVHSLGPKGYKGVGVQLHQPGAVDGLPAVGEPGQGDVAADFAADLQRIQRPADGLGGDSGDQQAGDEKKEKCFLWKHPFCLFCPFYYGEMREKGKQIAVLEGNSRSGPGKLPLSLQREICYNKSLTLLI